MDETKKPIRAAEWVILVLVVIAMLAGIKYCLFGE